MSALVRVKRAARARERSEVALAQAIRDAQAEGLSLRVIADAAGVSHMYVQRLLHQ